MVWSEKLGHKGKIFERSPLMHYTHFSWDIPTLGLVGAAAWRGEGAMTANMEFTALATTLKVSLYHSREQSSIGRRPTGKMTLFGGCRRCPLDITLCSIVRIHHLESAWKFHDKNYSGTNCFHCSFVPCGAAVGSPVLTGARLRMRWSETGRD